MAPPAVIMALHCECKLGLPRQSYDSRILAVRSPIRALLIQVCWLNTGACQHGLCLLVHFQHRAVQLLAQASNLQPPHQVLRLLLSNAADASATSCALHI